MSGIGAAVLAAGLAALFAWGGWAFARQRRRRRALLLLASGLGLRFSPSDPFDLPDYLFGLELFSRGHSRLARNVVNGPLEGVPVRLFDYQYELGAGRRRRAVRWQVAVAILGDGRLPGLLVRPGRWDEPLEPPPGYGAVEPPAGPLADRSYAVAAEDAEFAREFLDAEAARLLVEAASSSGRGPAAGLQAHGWTVCLYCQGLLAPQAAIRLLTTARKLAEPARQSRPRLTGAVDRPARAV